MPGLRALLPISIRLICRRRGHRRFKKVPPYCTPIGHHRALPHGNGYGPLAQFRQDVGLAGEELVDHLPRAASVGDRWLEEQRL